MSTNKSLDITETLARQFDDQSVRQTLTEVVSGQLDSWVIDTLLRGRGANLLWPEIEQRLKQNLSLTNIARLSDYLPKSEIISLLDRAAIDDIQIVNEIREGHFPALAILPIERRQRIYDVLRNIVKAESRSATAATILLFLLDFDGSPGTYQFTNHESLRLAIDWCLEFANESRVQPILSRLLWKRPSIELVRLAEKHLYNLEWTMNTTFVMLGLMEATRGSQNHHWVKVWHERSSRLDSFVISEWIRTTNCSRRAFAAGKEAIRLGYPGRRSLIREMSGFLHHKVVRRWMNRFIRNDINNDLVGPVISDIVRHSPTRHNCAFAKQVMKTVDDKTAHRILLELVKHTGDPEIVDLAIQQVDKFPNAPDSFELMCEITRSNSAVAVPWLHDWIKTALPNQTNDGLAHIVAAAPTPEHLKLAREWLSKAEKDQLPIHIWRRAHLLDTLLKVSSQQDIIEIASKLLETTSDKTAPALRKLSRRVGKTKDLVGGD